MISDFPVKRFDEDWDSLGDVVRRHDGEELVIDPGLRRGPGFERGLGSRKPYEAVELTFEACLEPGARLLAKVHQVDRVDQTTNSYHLLADERSAYLARHHHVFCYLDPPRAAWERWCLMRSNDVISLWRDDQLIHRVRDPELISGFAFIGAQGGAVRVRCLRLQPAKNSLGREGSDLVEVEENMTVTNMPSLFTGDVPMISYCIAVYRPTYARLLLADLVRKTTAPFEILIWLNVADADFDAVLDSSIAAGVPLRIIGRTPHNIGMMAYRMLFESARSPLITQIDDDVVCISPGIAERADRLFRQFPKVRQLVSDVWQDEFTTGARPTIENYTVFDSGEDLYSGPIDGWFSVYHRSILPLLISIPSKPYFTLGGAVSSRLAQQGLHGVLDLGIKVFHVIGPIYARAFGMLQFEIEKYQRLGRDDMVSWYQRESEDMDSGDMISERVRQIITSFESQGHP